MDPYTRVTRRQRAICKDEITLTLKAKDCNTWDQLTSKTGTPQRLMWRPPRDWKIQTAGAIHSDQRGQFQKFLGVKVTIVNKMNGKMMFKYTLPAGAISDPSRIYSRPVVTGGEIDPAGTKKTLSRHKGKGKKKVASTYSKSTDRVAINVLEKNVFRGDANLYTLYQETMPGDSIAAPTYNVKGFCVGDFLVTLTDINEYTDKPINADQDVATVHVVVRYMISRMGASEEAQDVTTCLNFARADLATPDAMFHVDVDEPIANTVALRAPATPVLTHLPYDGYVQLFAKPREGKYVDLYWGANKQPVAPFRWQAYEDGDTRILVPSLVYGMGSQTSGGWRPVFGSCEYGFDVQRGLWTAENPDGSDKSGQGVEESYIYTNQEGWGFNVSHGRIPAIVYSIKPPTAKTLPEALHSESSGNPFRNYGQVNARAVQWKDVASGLFTVIKVLTFLAQVATALA